jgi:hypothetical protein
MKRAVFTMLVVGVAAVAVAAASFGATASTRPTLQLVDGAPLTIRGVHFRAQESVQLTVSAEGRRLMRTKAGSGGSFLIRVPIRYNRCSGLSVIARGAKGSSAKLQRPAMNCRP